MKPQLTPNSLAVLRRRYLTKNDQGQIIESPEELFVRVASTIAAGDANFGATPAEVEEVAQGFYRIMARLEFLPNSPTLMNAGRRLGQLSACFVLPIGDSMDSIFETVKNTALIHKSGGGTGFAFSRLRPKNSVVASTSGVASGPVSFMKVINAATEAVKQGGTRRGANMGILRVDHPDILEFIKCKDDLSELNNFNISVAVTDEFMRAVKNRTSYPLLDPQSGRQHTIDGKLQTLDANEVFQAIIDHAHRTGEPGIIFIDRINATENTPKVGLVEATNPCGEQPLLPYESCNLGSINLSKVVRAVVDPSDTSKMFRNEIDWDKLRELVHIAVHFLDNVIEQNRYPLPEIEQATRNNRRIGLGVMGWADLLVMLDIPYNSDDALKLGDQLMEFIETEADKASNALAEKRGDFPNWEKSIFSGKGLSPAKHRRNSTVTTVAPTGTISIIAGCSSGIEPIFAVSYVRNVMDNTKLIETNPIFEARSKEMGFFSDRLMERIAEKNSIADFEEIPEDLRHVFVTAHDVTPEWHIKMQAVFQRHTENAVSKTINMTREATVDDVRTAYELSYSLNCKGVTIYRDGSRAYQVLSTKQTEGATSVDEKGVVKDRPEALQGITSKIKTGFGNLYVTIN
ncbi:MAG TPA: ribonucleotide-diphosphate reductase subunit alpha, partial [candidate division Zixibacteria bacterium]|nr:ribonucleotide-diphosphate reductase subunit alpha [candidate division Zixibacteria bacterium]